MNFKTLSSVTLLTLSFVAVACGGGSDGDVSGGDGDGDVVGDGDGDGTGDGDGDATGDGDDAGDGDSNMGDGDGDGDGDGMGGSPGEEPLIPVIESSFPADGDSGVLYNESFVVTFSMPMDTGSVEKAYKSADLPAEDVFFTWNEDKTELTIDPIENLKFEDGSDPEEIPLASYSFGIDGGAKSADGEPVEEPLQVSFTTARGMIHTIAAVPSLTGSVRSTESEFSSVWVGDSAFELKNGDDSWYIGLLSYDLDDLLGDVVAIESARIQMDHEINQGTPYATFNSPVRLYDIEFEERSWMTIEPQIAEDDVGIVTDEAGETEVDRPVSKSVIADFEAERLVQFGMAFDKATDEDDLADNVEYTNAELRVNYFIH